MAGLHSTVLSEPNFERDIQGIPWHTAPVTRTEFRRHRMREYAAREQRRSPSIYQGKDTLKSQECPSPLYRYSYTNRIARCTVQHFQLRHLLWSPNPSRVLFTQGSSVWEWDPIRDSDQPLLNFREMVGPHSRISTICATNDLLLVGGFYGELILRPLRGNTRTDSQHQISHEDNGIINHISPVGPKTPEQFLVSSNDSNVCLYDAQRQTVASRYAFPVPINASQMSPDQRLLCVVGDTEEGSVVDPRSGKTVLSLLGHCGYSFCCAWSPSGSLLVTGNEDHTSRIFDLRMTSAQSLHVIGSYMAPVRCVKFSPDGQVLVVMEEADFVSIYDAGTGVDFGLRTVVDFFGETSGIDFAPDSRFLYVGCDESDRGGILELSRGLEGSLVDKLDHLLL